MVKAKNTMHDAPLISIVTVCYNVSKSLSRTIQSVAKQSYKHIEYIVVDGNSTDGSIEIIKQNQNYISQWISEPDKGIYDAMNKGIDIASGDWIIFMNAGDEFYSESVIADIFARKINDDVKLIYGDVMLDFGKLGLLPKKYAKISIDSIPFEICHQSVFTKLDILKQIHYDLRFKICADCNSFVTIHKMGYKLEYIPVMISKFEVVDGVSSYKVMDSYFEHCQIEGINPYSYKRLYITIKTYMKSILLCLLPSAYYNKMRYRSIASREMYK